MKRVLERFLILRKVQKRELDGGFLKIPRRGLKRIDMIISDKPHGLGNQFRISTQEAKWQRCVVHFYRNVFSLLPHGRRKEVATMLKTSSGEPRRGEEGKDQIAEKLSHMKLR